MEQLEDNLRIFKDVFKVYNDSSLSNCVECRKCERHCPQKLNIVDTLKEAHMAMK